jgi:cellulose biosynthesis protein BcsQ
VANISQPTTTAEDATITWIDVARHLSSLDPAEDEWQRRPRQLRATRVDWRGLILTVTNVAKDRQAALDWLTSLYPDRIHGGEEPYLVLDGPPHSSRLPIEFEKDGWLDRRLRPNLGAVESEIDFIETDPSGPFFRLLPVIACHSVKGGTGRTITAVAAALRWSEVQRKPVLLVDADVEAPGISYIFRRAHPEAAIALEDLIAMAHADPDPNWGGTVEWVTERIPDQRVGDIIVLPLRRALDELSTSSIRSEHLATADRPYAFTDLLSLVAGRLDCAGIVIDARAGLGPLAAQLLLDPTVSRIFVTTLNDQSLEGTRALLHFIARELRRAKARLTPPLLVVNRVPTVIRELGQDSRLLNPILDDVTADFLRGENAEAKEDEPVLQNEIELNPIRVITIPEIADLRLAASRFSDYTEQISDSGFLRRFRDDFDAWLFQEVIEIEPKRSNLRGVAIPAQEPPAIRRERLHQFTGRFVAAETANEPIETPLVTRPMLALAKTFSGQLPIVVSEGAKGTGKTLTARFLVGKATWQAVVSEITGDTAGINVPVLPVLGSIQTSEKFLQEIDACRDSVAQLLSVGQPHRVGETKRLLRDGLTKALSDHQWTDIWLDAIAWSAGLNVGKSGAGTELIQLLRGAQKQLLCVIEGIEELYESASEPSVGPMLRALVIDLPVRLRSEAGRPLGLIIFARRDTIDAGVIQNREQFRTTYQDFALTWNEGDVLELAAWLTTQADALQLWSRDFGSFSDAQKAECLEPLWGRKLGRDDRPGQRTKEAYTANWVIAALSDLQGRLVARDLVRFVHHSAAYSPRTDEESEYSTRLLVPRALREAIGPTSEKKVTETEEEIGELRSAFAKFRVRPGQVTAPIDSAGLDVLGLTDDDINRLLRHGIIFGEAPPYEVPELFRMGLKLRHAGARHSVLALRRRARQRLTGFGNWTA